MHGFVAKRRTNGIVGDEERSAFHLYRRAAGRAANELAHVEPGLQKEEMDTADWCAAAQPRNVGGQRALRGFRVTRHDGSLVLAFGEIEIGVRGLDLVPAKVWRSESHARYRRQNLAGRRN